MYSVQFTVYSDIVERVQCTLYTVQCIVYPHNYRTHQFKEIGYSLTLFQLYKGIFVQMLFIYKEQAMYFVQYSALYTVHCTLYSTVYSVQCRLLVYSILTLLHTNYSNSLYWTMYTDVVGAYIVYLRHNTPSTIQQMNIYRVTGNTRESQRQILLPLY